MKRVLIITYYWPPSGGAGVQRWLKFSKYLPEFGWQPLIYTPENPEAPVEDHSLLKDIHPETAVLKRPIWEPYLLYKRFLGINKREKVNAGFLSESKKPGIKEKISVWIRGNLFIPDARKFWIKPSVKYLVTYLEANPVDAIITTGPPHSMHLIGLGLKERTGIPWISDFRDPWTEIDFYDKLMLSRIADKRHHHLEKTVLHGSDIVVVAGKSMANMFKNKLDIPSTVIHNGYDESDFLDKDRPVPEHFTIVHIGAMNNDRNHDAFWQAVANLVTKGELKEKPLVKLIGKIDYNVRQSIQKYQLEQFVEIIPHIPHDMVIHELLAAGILYLPVNATPNAKYILTGKLFEYLAAERPILGVGPEDGDSAEIIQTTGAGVMIDFDNSEKIEAAIVRFKEDFSAGKKQAVMGHHQYARRSLAKKYSETLNEISRDV